MRRDPAEAAATAGRSTGVAETGRADRIRGRASELPAHLAGRRSAVGARGAEAGPGDGKGESRLGANPRQMRGDLRPRQVQPEYRERENDPKCGHADSQTSSPDGCVRRSAIPQEQWDEQQEAEQDLDREAEDGRRRDWRRPIAGPITTMIAALSIRRLWVWTLRRFAQPPQTSAANGMIVANGTIVQVRGSVNGGWLARATCQTAVRYMTGIIRIANSIAEPCRGAYASRACAPRSAAFAR